MHNDDEKLTEREYREKLKDATELLEAFKRAAYLAHEI